MHPETEAKGSTTKHFLTACNHARSCKPHNTGTCGDLSLFFFAPILFISPPPNHQHPFDSTCIPPSLPSLPSLFLALTFATAIGGIFSLFLFLFFPRIGPIGHHSCMPLGTDMRGWRKCCSDGKRLIPESLISTVKRRSSVRLLVGMREW